MPSEAAATAEGQPAHPHHHEDSSIKETLISLIISFIMALVFRSYVVEAFVIPTGSMAPTLLGQHMLFKSDQSGIEWPVNPWDYQRGPGGVTDIQNPYPVQRAPVVTDPVSTSRQNPSARGTVPTGRAGYSPAPVDKPARSGDRILVQKYLYQLFEPQRFDVVVFKNPENANENFIKRLIGLPNEQVWIADGDIFARPIDKSSSAVTPKGDWKIQRKPRLVQEALWRLVYSSEYAPLAPDRGGLNWFVCPWTSDTIETGAKHEYRAAAAGTGDNPAVLRWDTANWPLTDWVPYNEWPSSQRSSFPVSDLRMRLGVRPDAAGFSAGAFLRTRGHEFRASLAAGTASISRRETTSDAASAWSTLVTATVGTEVLGPDRFTNIEFAHADQALELRVDGEVVCRAEYDWGPSERLLHATGTPGDEHAEERRNPLVDPSYYAGSMAELRWEFAGAPFTLARVGLDRDVYYVAATLNSPIDIPGEPRRNGPIPALGTHPMNLANLGPDQFFCCGDNSAASKDSRLWHMLDPWVADEFIREVGIVPRELMLGKAFFVYFPAPYRAGKYPVIPDVGRMRFIR
jgi:signal peptidase I